MKVLLEQEYDGFSIAVHDAQFGEIERVRINQEDTIEELDRVFKAIGIKNVTFEEVC